MATGQFRVQRQGLRGRLDRSEVHPEGGKRLCAAGRAGTARGASPKFVSMASGAWQEDMHPPLAGDAVCYVRQRPAQAGRRMGASHVAACSPRLCRLACDAA